MSAPATPATPQDDPGPPAANTPYYRGVLHGLIDRGADLARVLHEQAITQAAQQATAPGPQAVAPAQHAAPAPQETNAQPAPAPSATPDALIRIAASFDQVARAVRRCIAQAQSLDQPKQQQPARHPAQHAAPDRTAARKRIIRAIEDTIQRPPDNPDFEPPEVLLPEFRERMDAPDLDADIASRPVADIIKEICRDLGLAALPGTHPWKRRTPADIAELNARAAAPSRPTWTAGRTPGPAPQDGPAPQEGPAPQNGAAPQEGAAPQDSHPANPQPAPDPADRHEPGHPAAAIPRPHPGPARAPSGLPQDPAEAVAFVLHHTARTDVRWRPPPED